MQTIRHITLFAKRHDYWLSGLLMNYDTPSKCKDNM